MWTGNPWPQDLLLGSRFCRRWGNSPGPGKTSIHRQGAGLSGEGRGAWLWLVGRTCSPCTQAPCPPGSGAACGWGPLISRARRRLCHRSAPQSSCRRSPSTAADGCPCRWRAAGPPPAVQTHGGCARATLCTGLSGGSLRPHRSRALGRLLTRQPALPQQLPV